MPSAQYGFCVGLRSHGVDSKENSIRTRRRRESWVVSGPLALRDEQMAAGPPVASQTREMYRFSQKITMRMRGLEQWRSFDRNRSVLALALDRRGEGGGSRG
ncbi:hypothetical protein EYF80_039049 [Liparis tanakae]|uniref:Uncharacterized protein n=1 Tax=Liparis tanakae TaxID=230148 RepID=A0A4Z2GAZ1_9TELE|nr:hypothetical protein EYF80_039049 [Liparis tanakae]